jgi:hypothetical protein
MTIDLKKFESLRSKVSKLQRQVDRAGGALSQVMRKLQEEFDCESTEDAGKLKGKMGGEVEKAEKSFNKSMSSFEEEWGSILEN